MAVFENVAHGFKKHCRSFSKTLPMKIKNVTRHFLMRCPWFFETTGNIFLSLQGNEIGEFSGNDLIG